MLPARLGERGKGAWLGSIMPAFRTVWPLDRAGFALLAATGCVRAWREMARRAPGGPLNLRGATQGTARRSSAAVSQPKGNDVLKVYWTLELDHLEVPQKEFRTFLNQLCVARDREEFDRFMAEQRQATATRPLSRQRGS